MAKAEVNKTIIKKMIEVEEDVKSEVVLTLTMQEACALRVLTGSISGVPNGTIREYTDRIFNTLCSVVDDPMPNLYPQVYATVAFMPDPTINSFCPNLVPNEKSSTTKEAILKLYPNL